MQEQTEKGGAQKSAHWKRKWKDTIAEWVVDFLFPDYPLKPVDCIYCETVHTVPDIRRSFKKRDYTPHCKKCGKELYLIEYRRNFLRAAREFGLAVSKPFKLGE